MNSPRRLTLNDITRAINYLPKSQRFHYINPQTRTVIAIQEVRLPEGPIYIKRWNPHKGESEATANVDSISSEMMARIANAFLPYHPINFDRVLGASYNTRSALESLLAHTPEFYFCYPGRIDSYTGEIVDGHKHLMWCPDEPHPQGQIHRKETDIIISEMTLEATYDALVVPSNLLDGTLDIEIVRQHARIQIALILIGQQFGFKSWVAQNDRGIIYKSQPVGEMESVLRSLSDFPLLGSMPDAVRAGHLIDCIWFGNSRYMPAVMEIEHSTGVTSGLVRMKGFQDTIPSIKTRYVIVAPDELRSLVVEQANRPQFKDLNTKFFPYSAVEELYQLCQRRNPKGITQEFLDSYMEPVT